MGGEIASGHGQLARFTEDELCVDERSLFETVTRDSVPVDGPPVVRATFNATLSQVGSDVKGVPAVTIPADFLYLEVSDKCFAGFTGCWYPPVVILAARKIASTDPIELRIWMPVETLRATSLTGTLHEVLV